MTERVEFVFIANANGAIQAFQAIGAEAGKSAANVDKLGTQGAAGLQKVEVAAGKAGGAFGKLGQAAGALGGVATGVIGSSLVGFLSDAARAAAEAEASAARLQQAFDNAGTSTDAYATELQRASDAALALAFDDEDAADAIATMTGITGDAAQSIDLLSTAMDLARGRQISLSQAATIVGRVAAGNTQILTRYGIVLEDGATAAEALAAVQQKYGGQAEAYANTQAGAMDRMRVSWANFVETVGGATGPLQTVLGLLPGMSVAFQTIGGAVGGLTGAGGIGGLTALLNPLTLGIGAAVAVAGTAAVAFFNWRDAMNAAEDAAIGLAGAVADIPDPTVQAYIQGLATSMDDLATAALNGGKSNYNPLSAEAQNEINQQVISLGELVNAAQAAGMSLDTITANSDKLKVAVRDGNILLADRIDIQRDLTDIITKGSDEAITALAEVDAKYRDNKLTAAEYDDEVEKIRGRVVSMGDSFNGAAGNIDENTDALKGNRDAIIELALAQAKYYEGGNLGGGVTVVSNEDFKKQLEAMTEASIAAAAKEAEANAKVIDQTAQDAIDAAKKQEDAVVSAAQDQADAVVAAAEKAADAQVRSAEKAGKAQVKAAESAGKEQIRAAERAEAGQVKAAQNAADAQIAAAEAAAEGQIDAARKAEEAQVAAAEKAANAQIRAAEQVEKDVTRAAQKQANAQIRAAEQAANRQVAAAQRAADQLTAEADRLEQQASAAAQAQEERTVAAAQRAHDKRVAAAENAADREIAAAKRATEETLFQIEQRLSAANRQASSTANVEINAATDEAFKKISDAAAKYGEDSVQYEKAVADATSELAKKQEEAYNKQAEAQRKAAEEAAAAQREAQREEERRIAEAERARDRAIARSAAKQQAIEERAHQEALRRQEEAARQAEALREEAARRVAAAEQQAARQVEQVKREAQRELARKEREAARATADVRRQIEQNLAAQKEAAAARAAAAEEAAAARVEAVRVQAERNVELAARSAARNTEKVRREVQQTIRAEERQTAQEVRAINRETTDIQKAQAQEVADITQQAADDRIAAEQRIRDDAATAKEEILLMYAEADPKIADLLEKAGLIKEGASGTWEIVLDEQTQVTLDALEKVVGEDGTLDAKGTVTLYSNANPLIQRINDLRRSYAAGQSVAYQRVTLIPDSRYLPRANGGTVPAAADGRTVLVGEAGPELVQLPVGSRVTASPASRAMLAAGGGGMGGISITIQGDVYGMPDFERKVGEAAASVLGRALPQALADRRRALGVA